MWVFIMVKRGQNIGKDRHPNEEQDDDSAERPQRFLPPQSDEEILKPAPTFGLMDGGGCLLGDVHILDFSIIQSRRDERE